MNWFQCPYVSMCQFPSSSRKRLSLSPSSSSTKYRDHQNTKENKKKQESQTKARGKRKIDTFRSIRSNFSVKNGTPKWERRERKSSRIRNATSPPCGIMRPRMTLRWMVKQVRCQMMAHRPINSNSGQFLAWRSQLWGGADPASSLRAFFTVYTHQLCFCCVMDR